MPGLDHTGPEGQGPRTGRGMGNCRPKTDEKTNNDEERNFYGRGFGRRHRGRGRGFGRGFGRQ